jgi:alkylhydroperoxidase family enzyme
VLADWRTAPVDARVRAALGFVETMTLRPEQLGPDDLVPLRAAGLSDAAIEDAIHVCALFSIYTRLADSLGFDIPSADAFSRAADMLLSRGYQ